ncbi:MAG TPA: tetratricopeptide repeat protein [Terriglobales bacterium]
MKIRGFRHYRLFAVVCTSVLISVLACSRNPEAQKHKYFQNGQQYFAQGKYREAAIEFLNAVKIDPQYADAHYQLAQTYLKLQQGAGGVQELSRTVELQPGNYQARMELANLLILGHDFQTAQQHTDLLIKQRPNDPAVHSLISSLFAAQDNVPAAIDEVQKAIALDAARWEFHLELALLESKSSQSDKAEASFKKVIELNPAATEAYLLLGAFYQSNGRFSDAEQQYRKAIEVGPSNVEPRAAMIRLYLAEGKKSAAEDLAKRTKYDLPNDPTAYRMLADLYFATGDSDKAMAEYGALCQLHPKDLELKKAYIQLLIQQERWDEAEKLNNELLKGDPNLNDALIYRSQMQIGKGDLKDATATLQAVLKKDPNNSEGHYVLGVAFEKAGDLQQAETEWMSATHIRPDLVDAYRSLAGLALRRGDPAKLAEAATQIIRLQPASPDGYSLRALAEINRKEFIPAEADIRKAIQVAPQSSTGYVQLGNLRSAQAQYDEAVKAYEQALDRNPNSKDALRGLINAYVALKQVDKAIAAANTQIAKSPDNAGFYDLLGTLLFRVKRDFNGAEAAFEKSIQLDTANPDSLLKLAEVKAAQGSIDGALAICAEALKGYPNDASFPILMGELYESRRDWPKTIDAYQKALAIRPDDPVASNNLAWAMVQSGGNLEIALSLAQTARRGMPDSPSAADTLGWVYYQKSDYGTAIHMFQDALKLTTKIGAPDDPGIHYHLGMAYAKTNQPTLARQQLQLVLKINPNFREADEVKKQLALLG